MKCIRTQVHTVGTILTSVDVVNFPERLRQQEQNVLHVVLNVHGGQAGGQVEGGDVGDVVQPIQRIPHGPQIATEEDLGPEGPWVRREQSLTQRRQSVSCVVGEDPPLLEGLDGRRRGQAEVTLGQLHGLHLPPHGLEQVLASLRGVRCGAGEEEEQEVQDEEHAIEQFGQHVGCVQQQSQSEMCCLYAAATPK